MILEGLVTTVTTKGSVNLAPMGPYVEPGGDPLTQFELRPFRTANTYANLKAHPEGVLHVVDDVLLLARAALGEVDPLPPLIPARQVRGFVLETACRALEFRIVECEETELRVRMRAEVLYTHRLRDFFGLNRAMFAVVEAAILATRTAFLPVEQIEPEYARLRVLVEKTGGPREQQAFELLEGHLQRVKRKKTDDLSG